MNPSEHDVLVNLRRESVLLTASYFALKRQVLELGARQTDQPLAELEDQHRRYVEVELARLLQQLPEAERRLSDPR